MANEKLNNEETVEFEMCVRCEVLYDADVLEDGLCEDCITIPKWVDEKDETYCYECEREVPGEIYLADELCCKWCYQENRDEKWFRNEIRAIKRAMRESGVL